MAAAIVGGAAAAVVAVVVIAAVVIAALTGGSGPNLSIAGAWNDGAGNTWTFTSSVPGSYTVGTVNHSAPQCAQPDDGTVTGGNGHFAGSINLWEQDYSGSGCAPKTGVGQITITVAATGTTANVTTAGSDCASCGQETWTRQS
jgi:hypothetical protein